MEDDEDEEDGQEEEGAISTYIKSENPCFLDYRINDLLEVLVSKGRLKLKMASSMQDLMASGCPYFVDVIFVQRPSSLTEKGAEYYLLDSTGKKIKIGESVRRITKNLIYVADTTFIKKYSALFNLGQEFQWKKKADFDAWDILAASPKFIEPHLRSANALVVPRSIDAGIAYQPSWFLHAVIQIKDDMEVIIPEESCPYTLAPPPAVAIVHSRTFERLRTCNGNFPKTTLQLTTII